MITFTRRIETHKGRHAVRFRPKHWRTPFFASGRFGRWRADHVYVLAIFPIWPKVWVAFVFLKFWKEGWIE